MAAPSQALRAALAGRYEIERELGQGGMATVYLARDLRHHRQVAIKVVKPDLAASLGAERFLREIDTAASLTHPNILPLHDSGEAGGFLYYVMPYVEGESLRTKLQREKQLPLDEALRIAREVADALDCAHVHGVVHRDVKPANILLESGHAVVVDFGIARAISAAGGEALTETGTTVGTPAYMSPEQAAGSANVDGRSDLYSLGCVLYEMLAGQPPFSGPTAESVVHQHLSVAPRPVTDLRPAVPAWVAVALQRALAKAPADRFSTVSKFSEALAHQGAEEPRTTIVHEPPRPSRRWRPLAALSLTAAVVVVGAFLLLRPGRYTGAPSPAAPVHARSAIAVLPFQNLSADSANAYFAGGLHDELLTQLAQVASLKVISRTSVMGYQGTAKPLTRIADELGVGSIVEGTVQVVGGRLRVNVQLIDADTDQHLWAERYDRTLDDAFAIQSEVAQRIVAAVGAALSSEEQGRLAAVPTANAEAYRLYLQGREYFRRPAYLRTNLESAQRLYEQALHLDPRFALAYAALSMVHGRMYWLRYDPSPQRAARQREEAEAALRLAPDLPQAHAAMGDAYYRGRRNYRRALDELEIARQGLPNDAEVVALIGYVHRRLGNWDRVLASYQKAVELSPRDADLPYDLGGNTYTVVRRYADAVRAYERALRLAPDLDGAAVRRGWAYLRWHGQLDTLNEALNRVPSEAELGTLGSASAQRAALMLLERDAGGLLQMPKVRGETVFEGQDFFLPSTLYAGWAHELRGEDAAARTAFDVARARADAVLKELPDDCRVHAARGLALAGLGRRQEALDEALWLERSGVYRGDAFQGTVVAEDRARILARVGEKVAALDQIERLLAKPSWLSVHTLRLDPRWDPIRNQPRFEELLREYGSRP